MANPYREIMSTKPGPGRPMTAGKAFAIGARAALSLENPLKRIALERLDSCEAPAPEERVACLARLSSPAAKAALKGIRRLDGKIARGVRAMRLAGDSNLEGELFQSLVEVYMRRSEIEQWLNIIASGTRWAGAGDPAVYRNWGEGAISEVRDDPKASLPYHRLLDETARQLCEADFIILRICAGRGGLPERLRALSDALAEASARSLSEMKGRLGYVECAAIWRKVGLQRLELRLNKAGHDAACASLKILKRIEREIDAGTPEPALAKMAPVEDRIILALDNAQRCVGDIAKEAGAEPLDERLKVLLNEAKETLGRICGNRGKLRTREAGDYASEISMYPLRR